ncbi:hypothetical protein SGLAM104S_07110 [Streptomyces glaucescens]
MPVKAAKSTRRVWVPWRGMAAADGLPLGRADVAPQVDLAVAVDVDAGAVLDGDAQVEGLLEPKLRVVVQRTPK